MTRLSNDPKEDLWSPIMRCPKCGYETTVTNICRSCPETSADQELTAPRYCDAHGVVHCRENPDGSKTWLGHGAVTMVYTGYVRHWKTGRKRKYEPKDDDEKMKLWAGWGVVF